MPVGTALAIAAGANIIGGLAGAAAAGKGGSDAMNALQGAQNNFNIGIPTVADQSLSLANPDLQFLQNARESALQQQQSQLANISVDPAYKAAQMAALNKLSQVGQNGMTDVMHAQEMAAQRDVAAQEQARQNSILENMAQRGIGGSGVELAARLASSQGGADRALQNSNNIQSQAQQNMLSALSQSGQLGGSMQAEQFGELAKQASAQDVINQFNTQNAQNVGNTNVQLQNAQAAQQQAAVERQAALKNQQQMYNKQLLQQQFSNQMEEAKGKAGLASNIASTAVGSANAQAGMFGGIGQGIGQVAAASIPKSAPSSNV